MTENDEAKVLAEARRNRTRSTPLLSSGIDENEAYTLQDAAADAYGCPRIGYKIGATSPEARRIIGCDGPFYGPMFEADLIAPGSKVPVDETMLGLECEFAFQMARAFPNEGDARTREAVAGAIARCVPAFEIVGSHIVGSGFPTATSCIADFGLNALFCPGSDMPNWRNEDLAAMAVTASVDGVETNSGDGSNVYGHPLDALLWLVGALEQRGRRLEEGDWISTGTCLGVVAIQPGSSVTTRFSNGAELSMSFA